LACSYIEDSGDIECQNLSRSQDLKHLL